MRYGTTGPGLRALALVLIFFTTTAVAEMSPRDEKFLDKLEKDSFKYFLREINPENGLIKDSSRPGAPASVAVAGFGLTALCVGESRGWISEEEAYARVLQILRTFKYNVPHEKGFFYHFLDMRTAKRAWSSEVSSIDTALFLAGALFAGEYFKGTEAEKIAKELYERVDWPWMLNGKNVLCMGWKPETGFLYYYWDTYSEAIILYALAIGSPTRPISTDAWLRWKRARSSYKGLDIIYSYFGSIFAYQYSHAWIDFKELYDIVDNINYYSNSVSASLANKEFCIENSGTFRTYGENAWGLTACIGPKGYKGYGAKPGEAFNDGTIAPCGMAGSLVFTPEDAIGGLQHIYNEYRGRIYGKYGFKDAFNVDQNWWAEEYLGIDVGITVLMIENYRTRLIWDVFMRVEPIRYWMGRCFQK